MNVTRVRSWSLVATCAALLACGDDDGNAQQPTERAPILSASAATIAAAALSDAPSQDFVVARTRVEMRVPRERTQYTRSLALGAGRAAAVVADPMVRESRRLAATALGATLDSNKESDVVSAQASIDALMQAVQKVAPAATSCDALPAGKAEACAIAFLILEVQRSEGVLPTPDAGVSDAGTDAGPSVSVDAISCGTRDVAGAKEVSGTITESQTWTGKVLIKGTVYVSGSAKITIAAGTEIFMDVDSGIVFGYTGSDVSVKADGTTASPIKICGKVAEKGYWGKLTFDENVTSDSYLRNVLIAEGGGSDFALELQGDLTLDNVQVADSGKDGVSAQDFKVGGKLLSVRGSTGYPLVLGTVAALAHLPLDGKFTGNGTDFVVLRFGTIDADVTLHNVGVPYLQEQTFYQNKGNLVVEAGVEWRMKSDVGIVFAYLDATSVQMQGTEAAPVRFVPVDGNAHWGLINFQERTASNSKLTYVEFVGGGQNHDSALQVDATITLDHVKLTNNLKGLQVGKLGLGAGSKNLTVTQTQGRPLSIDLDGVFGVPSEGIALTGNMIDQVELTGGTLSKGGTIPDLGVPYYFQGTMYAYKSITIAPGARFVLGASTTLNLGYNSNSIIAAGTAEKPIKFSGEEALRGFWRGIVLNSSTLSNSKFDYVQIDDAGESMGAALTIDVPATITNSKFNNSAGYGISKTTAIATDYTMGGNTFTACALGNVTTR